MGQTPPSVEMSITELRRSADGSLEDAATVIKFSAADHSSAVGDLELYLKVNTVRKEMPGSNEVVEQVMAATWQPFEMDGEWDDKWGNRRDPAGSGLVRTGAYAFSMYQAMADLVARMSQVRLEIDALSLVGIITDFKIRYRTKTKIGWHLTMSPHQNENLTVPPPTPKENQPIQKWLQDAKDQGDKLNALFGDMKSLSLTTPRADLFTRSMLEINDALDRLQAIGGDGFGTDTEAKLLLMATTFRRMRGAAIQATLALNRLTSADEIAFDDALAALSFATWTTTSITEMWRTVGISRRAEDDMTRRAAQKPRALYYPMQNESLEKISNKFYGTADAWRTIYDANHLHSLILSGTEELVIPERRA